MNEQHTLYIAPRAMQFTKFSQNFKRKCLKHTMIINMTFADLPGVPALRISNLAQGLFGET